MVVAQATFLDPLLLQWRLPRSVCKERETRSPLPKCRWQSRCRCLRERWTWNLLVSINHARVATFDVGVIFIAGDQKIDVAARKAIFASRGKSGRDNLSPLVDVVRLVQVCAGIGNGQAIQVNNRATVFPKECPRRFELADGQRSTDNLPLGVGHEGAAARVAFERSEVRDDAVLPAKSVIGLRTRHIRLANYFPVVREPDSDAIVAPQGAEVAHLPLLPKKRMEGLVSGEIRRADDLTAVVDEQRPFILRHRAGT